MKYVYIRYLSNNLYKIGQCGFGEGEFNPNDKIVRFIRTDNTEGLINFLTNKFFNKIFLGENSIFKLNDQDILFIQQLPDEWEEPERMF